MSDNKIYRYYLITWYPTKDAKYGNPINRTNKVTLSSPVGEVSVDAKNALNLFINTFGNLNTNTIVSIKEFNENGQIGEDITPSNAESTIIPTRN